MLCQFVHKNNNNTKYLTIMRKSIFYLAFMALIAVGCQQELGQDNPSGNLSKVMFTAVTESSADVKTSLNPSVENEKIYNIHWSEGDLVLVSDGATAAEFTTVLTDNPTCAGLATYAQENVPAEGADNYYAVFPSHEGAVAGPEGYTVVIPATQTWEKGEFDMPMVGRGGFDNKISFMNAASILKITPNNLCDSYDGVRVAKIEVSAASDIAGKVAVSYDGTDEPSFGIVEEGSKTITLDCGTEGAEFSETFYIALVPGSYESLTIKITSNGGGSQTFTLKTPAEKSYERSEYASIGVKISNLAIYETANCYLVTKPGTYKFPVNVKGNGNTIVKANTHDNTTKKVTSSADVSVFDASIDVSKISQISASVISQFNKSYDSFDLNKTLTEVSRNEDYVTFTVPENFAPGNVRINVLSTDGSCLWSWHIWVNDQVMDVSLGDLHSSVKGVEIMNMNLGSLQTADNLDVYAGVNSGLYYQFGRKDPFPPYNGSDATLPAVYTLDQNLDNSEQRRVSEGTSVKYPMNFVTGNQTSEKAQVRTWCTNAARDHWGATPADNKPGTGTNQVVKTCFDPCPPGYHVMSAFVWKSISYNESISTATFESRLLMSWPYADESMQTTKGNQPVFPFDGYRTAGEANNYTIAGNLLESGSAPYYWTASYYNDGSINGNIVKFKSVSLKATEESKSNESRTIAGHTKAVKSFACSIRAQKQ